MRISRFLATVLLGSLLGAVGATGVAWPGGVAAPETGSKPSAIVAIGDSYLSGEAAGDYAPGTDTASNQCHQSTRSLIHQTGLTNVDVALNLACSGSTTANLRLGGTDRYGGRSQIEQLGDILAVYDVRAVVVSVGGNDLGFGEMIRDCIAAYLPLVADCGDAIAARLPAQLDQVSASVGAVLDDVHAVLAEGGHGPDDAQVVLVSYPSPVTERIRSPWLRLAMGCPFTLNDLAFARNELTPSIANAWAEVAASRGDRFLDLSRALEGHEVCARGASPGSEWAKGIFVNTAQIRRCIGMHLISQSLHPNEVGHAQLGRCLGRFLAMTDASALCLADPDHDGALTAVATTVSAPISPSG